jgi:hypothetical protein
MPGRSGQAGLASDRHTSTHLTPAALPDGVADVVDESAVAVLPGVQNREGSRRIFEKWPTKLPARFLLKAMRVACSIPTVGNDAAWTFQVATVDATGGVGVGRQRLSRRRSDDDKQEKGERQRPMGYPPASPMPLGGRSVRPARGQARRIIRGRPFMRTPGTGRERPPE